MKAPKKPKVKKLPKKPKPGAALVAWERYEKRIHEVRAQNKKAKSEYEKQMKAIEAAKKKKAAIIKTVSGLGAI